MRSLLTLGTAATPAAAAPTLAPGASPARRFSMAAIAVLGCLALGACSSTEEAQAPLGDDPSLGRNTAGTGAGVGGVGYASLDEGLEAVGDRVFFAFDSADLTPQAESTLRQQADLMNRFPGTVVTIEGHADERGTREYNFALGARRATAAKNYLVALGVPSNRIRTISYGKERPVDPRPNEAAWAQNRRAVTVVGGAGS